MSFLLKFFVDVHQQLSCGVGWSRWGNLTIFMVKCSPKWLNPLFYQFSFAIVNGSFGHPDFRRHFCQNFSWTFDKTLDLESVGPDGKAAPFSSFNDPRSRFLTSFLLKFFLEVRQDLRYGAGWSL
ncbi:hypothetical protein H5410_056469 [Solanum commersonii]|uniref:Uncharacterized protein n=1 Tax=Solanum commersonii TaxID=4109 RepID=A0A9J5WM90_SOLCO|nr:hypothetical protein H5410_056469 [Solanum commersonii]